jgi:hypothetical protein
MTYQEGIELLRKAKPDHVLLRLLSEKETAVNFKVLESELKKHSVKEMQPICISDQQADQEDEVLRGMRMQLSGLYVDRAKLSNTFHDCSTNQERRVVSEKVQVVQARIVMLRQQIRAYKDTGRSPESDEKYPVPENPFQLLALRDSLRASISRKKREIMHLAREVGEKTPGAAEKLPKAEAKLKDLQNHIHRVEEAVNTRNLQPGRLSER